MHKKVARIIRRILHALEAVIAVMTLIVLVGMLGMEILRMFTQPGYFSTLNNFLQSCFVITVEFTCDCLVNLIRHYAQQPFTGSFKSAV